MWSLYCTWDSHQSLSKRGSTFCSPPGKKTSLIHQHHWLPPRWRSHHKFRSGRLTTTIRLRFDCGSTAIRPCYDCSSLGPICSQLLHRGRNKYRRKTLQNSLSCSVSTLSASASRYRLGSSDWRYVLPRTRKLQSSMSVASTFWTSCLLESTSDCSTLTDSRVSYKDIICSIT